MDNDRERPERPHDAADELRAARLARQHALDEMTMSERLARTHELCAQLSKLRPIESAQR